MAAVSMSRQPMSNPKEPPQGLGGSPENFRRTMQLAALALTISQKDSVPTEASSVQAPPRPVGGSSLHVQDASPDWSDDEIVPERKSMKRGKSTEQ